MVASDTLVGLVGAGILLVALVGVFVFESKETATEKSLAAIGPDVEATTAKLDYDPSSGVTNPITNQCIGTCTPQRVKLTLTLESAPTLPGSTLKYAAFLTGGTQPLFLGVLAKDQNAYKIAMMQGKDAQPGSNRLVVSLEKTANPTMPSEIVVFDKSFSQPAATADQDVNIPGKYPAQLAPGAGESKLRETDQGLQVDVTLTGAKNYSSAGYAYRVWLHDSGANTLGYTFVGNLTASGNQSTLSVVVAGAQLDSFEHVFITIEPTDASTPRAATEAGGPTLYTATLSEPGLTPLR
jgi:hypothetical protein